MPYKEHSWFKPPEERGIFIWRYMSFTKLLALLNNKALYFARADKLAEMDPFEGRFSHVNAELMNVTWDMAPSEYWAENNFKSEDDLKRFIESKKAMFDTYSTMREIHFINCWHISDGESDAMWKLYSGTQDGVCIQSTFDGFVKSLQDTEEVVHIGKVNYIDYSKELIDEGMVFAPLLCKRLWFKHEQELRAIFARAHDTEYEYLYRDGTPATAEDYHQARIINKYPGRYGLNVPINVSKLVNKIYVSPTSAPWFKELVQSMTEKLGYEFEIKNSGLADTVPIF